MKRNILNKAFLIICCFVAFGCKVRKPVTPALPATGIKESANFSKTEILQKISARPTNYQTAVIKAKADLAIGNNSHDVSMNIRMQKDKVIWVSVTAIAGIEVARALITPDSIKVLNKLQSVYIKKPFSFIYKYANKQIDFSTLQNMFLGDPLKGTLTDVSTVDINGGKVHVNGSLTDLAYSLIFNENYELIANKLSDKTSSQSLLLNYADYKDAGKRAVPYTVSIKSNAADKQVSIDLKYSQVSIDDLVDFPFTVSKRFTVQD